MTVATLLKHGTLNKADQFGTFDAVNTVLIDAHTAAGAKGDVQSVSDAAMTSGSAVVTSASKKFTAADVNKLAWIPNAGALVTPPGAPTLAAGAAGNPSGTYLYKVTFLTVTGETSGGTTSAPITVTAQQVSLSGVPLGPGGTAARKIYRTPAGGADGTQKLVGQISDNQTQTFTDNIADGSLGAAVPVTNTATTTLASSIASYGPATDGSQVTLAAPCGNPAGVTAKTFEWGTDDTATLNTLLATLPAGSAELKLTGTRTYYGALRLTTAGTTLTADKTATLKTPPGAQTLVNDAAVRIFADHCTVRGVVIDGNRTANMAIDDFLSLGREADGIGIYANDAMIVNNRISNMPGHGVIVWAEQFQNGGAGPVLVASGARQGFVIHGNHISNGRNRSLIDVSTTIGNPAVGPWSSRASIVGNILEGNTTTAQQTNQEFGITCHAAAEVAIIGNYVNNCWGGINTHTNSHDLTIHGNVCVGQRSMGIRLGPVWDSVVTGNRITSPATWGIDMEGIDDVSQFNQRVIIQGNRISGASTAGIISQFNHVEDIDILDNYITGITGGPAPNGILLVNGAGGGYRVRAKGNKFRTIDSQAILDQNTASQDWLVQDNYFDACGVTNSVDCVSLFNGNDPVVQGNTAKNSYRFLRIAGNNFTVKSNTVDTMANGAIIVNAATTTGCVITHNRFLNITGNVFTSTRTNLTPPLTIRNNEGWITENDNSTTIGAAATSVTPNHGMSETPGTKDFTVTPLNNLGTAAKFWLSSVGASTFTVNVDAAPGATVAFAWSCRIVQ